MDLSPTMSSLTSSPICHHRSTTCAMKNLLLSSRRQIGRSDHPAGNFNRYGSERALYFGFYPLREIFDLRIFVLTHDLDLTLAWVSPSFERSWYSLCSLSIL